MKVLVERERILVCEGFDILSERFEKSSFDDLMMMPRELFRWGIWYL